MGIILKGIVLLALTSVVQAEEQNNYWGCSPTQCAIMLKVPDSGMFIVPPAVEKAIIKRYLSSLTQASLERE